MKTALVIIDMQQGLMDEGPWKPDALVEAVTGLVDAARAAGAPVFFISDRRVEPGSGLVPSLAPAPEDVCLEKCYCDAFLETALEAELHARSIEQLVVAGMQTDYCIDTTCRSAASRGYRVLLAGDAHSTCDHEHLPAEKIVAHHNRVLRNLPAGRGSVSVVKASEVGFV